MRIGSPWSGDAPALDTKLEIVSRAAVDLKPVDARSREDRERMLAYIWPEQTERLRRIELIGKHIRVNAFQETVNVNGLDTLGDRLERATQRLEQASKRNE